MTRWKPGDRCLVEMAGFGDHGPQVVAVAARVLAVRRWGWVMVQLDSEPKSPPRVVRKSELWDETPSPIRRISDGRAL